MSAILSLVLPFFGLVGLGYGAGRLRLVAPEGAGGLNFLVLYVALPAFFFQSIVESPPVAAGAVSFVLTTTFATYCAFAIAFSIGALVNRGNVPEATVQGLAGSYSNTGYLAPALVLAAFGPAAAVPTGLIFTFDNALLFVATPLMMALGGTMRANRAKLAEEIARAAFLHPIVIATALGLVFLAIGIRLPGPLDAVVSLARHAAAPGALFVLGLALSFRPIGRVAPEMPAILAVKLVVHPVIVYLLLGWVGGFDRVWVSTAILLAALPPALDVLTLAGRYRVYGERASTTLLLAMATSVATVTIALILLVNGLLPSDPFR
jgi:predicted permease